ncbi:MAG: O-antigen ligase domain-containing protein, partial [Alphaproteobacteria bacterium]
MRDRHWGWLASVYVALCLLLGGASAAGAVANGFLQVAGLAILVLLAWVRGEPRSLPQGTWTLVALVCAFLLWGLVQLVPLPWGLWSGLPGRPPIAEALGLLGAEPATMPLSLAPVRTVDSLLWLIPPSAVFFLLLRLPSSERRRVAMAALGVALLSIALGAFQVLGGDQSPLRFYDITNPTSPVGFFSNKNHLATLLLCSLPVAAALAGRNAGKDRDSSRRHSARMVYGSVGLFIAIGVAINGSMAGYGLLLPAAFASLLIYRRAATGKTSGKGLLLLVGLLVAFIGFSAF